MASGNKNWAKEYILDPLTAPEPSAETGPGSHFIAPKETHNKSGTVTPPRSGNPFRQSHGSPTMTDSYPSPPQSSSPRKSSSAYRQEALNGESRHRRSSSLGERFPGDTSHRPLDQLAKEKARADRSRHATKKHHIQPDQVDRLDAAAAGGAYHHGGPYDATLFARNNSYNSSPVAAVASTNHETLKATPKERLIDSIERHRPLDGVAEYPPGQPDANGRIYQYQQGENMMIDLDPPGGAYKRWPGLDYLPDDTKGKSEPSYSIEKALKQDRGVEEKRLGEATDAVEMTTRDRSDSSEWRAEAFGVSSSVSRSGSLSKRLSEGFKKGIGSIKRSNKRED